MSPFVFSDFTEENTLNLQLHTLHFFLWFLFFHYFEHNLVLPSYAWYVCVVLDTILIVLRWKCMPYHLYKSSFTKTVFLNLWCFYIHYIDKSPSHKVRFSYRSRYRNSDIVWTTQVSSHVNLHVLSLSLSPVRDPLKYTVIIFPKSKEKPILPLVNLPQVLSPLP